MIYKIFGQAAISLRSRLVIPAAAVMLALSAGLAGVGYWAGNKIADDMTKRLIVHISSSIRTHVETMMDAPSRMMSRVRNHFSRSRVSMKDQDAIAAELYSLLRDEPYVDFIFYANEAGGIVSVGRIENGSMVILMTDNFKPGLLREYHVSSGGRKTTLRKTGVYFDARLKDWYRTAAETRKAAWTKPYMGSAEPILAISTSLPAINEQGEFAGAYGLDLVLTQLSDFMKLQNIGKSGRFFLIGEDDYLIAASGGILPVEIDAAGRQKRLHPADVHDPVVRSVARYFEQHPVSGIMSRGSDVNPFIFKDDDLGRISAAVSSLRLSDGSSWVVVAAVPVSEFLDTVYNAGFMSLGLAAFIVLSSIIAGFLIIGRVLRPMDALTKAAHTLAAGEWPDVPGTDRKDEIGMLARAFASMTHHIRRAHEELEQRVIERTRELSEANLKLKELDRLKSMFIASMSHELRTPLNSVIGFSSILLDEWTGPLNPEQKENLSAILRSGKHLLSLINDVIDVSKVEAGKIDIDVSEFDIYDLIMEAHSAFEREIVKKGIELKLDVVHQKVRTDRMRLLQCLLNLISNAEKFTIKGNITIMASRRVCQESVGQENIECIEVSVTDTGIGIRQEDMPKLFSPFVRLASPLKTQVPGTGLGLYLTKKLVTEVLKGEIICTSKYGEGSTFHLKIPVKI